MTFNPNQTRITKTKGEIAFARLIDSNIACTVDPLATIPLLPAQAVKLAVEAAGTMDSPIVVQAATPTSDIFGFVINGLRSGSYPPGVQLDVAIDGAIMIMEASGAMSPGTRVGVSATLQQIVNATSADIAQIGILLDKAVNVGDLVRVLIKTPHLASLSYDS